MTSRRTASPRPGKGKSRPTSRSSASAQASRVASRSTTRAAADADGSADEAAARARAKLTGRAAILLLVLAVLAVSYASSTRAWLRQRSDIDDLTATIKASRQQVAELEQEQRRWNDPAYVKTQARLRFGWVMPGETGYRVIGDNGRTLSDGTSELDDPVAAASGDSTQWWDDVWGSVVTAGDDADESAAPDDEPASRIGGHGQPSSRR